MSHEEAIQYWIHSAEECVVVAQDNQKRHPEWTLFFWQLAIEKMLKALLTKARKASIPTHDLVKLAKNTRLPLSASKEKKLQEITTYNIEARYDDYKRTFYKKTHTKIYLDTWSINSKEIYLWLKKQL